MDQINSKRWKRPKPLRRAAHCDMFYRLRWLRIHFQLNTYTETATNCQVRQHATQRHRVTLELKQKSR
ncbi:hypothetical protein R3I94_018018 [Phoxinus phoxinus]